MLLPGSEVAPGTSAGMHTLPSSWQLDSAAQPLRFGHRLPIPPQSAGGAPARGGQPKAGGAQAGGAMLMAGPSLGRPPDALPLEPPVVAAVPAPPPGLPAEPPIAA